MKNNLRWLNLVALFLLPLFYSATYADSVTLAAGSSQTLSFGAAGGASATVTFSLNAAGTQLTINATNLSPLGSGIDLVRISFVTTNPGAFVTTGGVLSGGFATQGFLSPGQSGGGVLSLSRAVPEGFINPTYIVVFRVNGQEVTVQAAPVPEPATLALVGMGLAGVAARRWRRKARRELAS
ncbi:MAG: PEP-CTERM sorting domain-containing protein [Acidobacteria bacterium]|nr:PEP-CTERM sorting domain-containing protein [Acidobacteriota bacterium]